MSLLLQSPGICLETSGAGTRLGQKWQQVAEPEYKKRCKNVIKKMPFLHYWEVLQGGIFFELKVHFKYNVLMHELGDIIMCAYM